VHVNNNSNSIIIIIIIISSSSSSSSNNNNNNNNRNNAHLLYSVCRSLAIETTHKWYVHTHTHTHKPLYEQEDVTVLWKHAVHTGREVTANRPDIIIKNKKEKTCILIDVAIATDRVLCKGKQERC
jgi:hypothetical protein